MIINKTLKETNHAVDLKIRSLDRLGGQTLSKFHPASLLLAPALAWCMSWGDANVYRLAQSVTIALIALLSFRYVMRYPCRVSGVAMALLASLWFPYLFVLVRDSSTGAYNHEMVTFWKLVAFSILFVAFDLSRMKVFASALRSGAPIASLVVALSTFQIIFDPTIVNGRHLYFGAHPNFGGEILFGAGVCLITLKTNWLRWTSVALLLFVFFSLQSRAALAGFLMVWVSAEWIIHRASLSDLSRKLLILAAATGLLTIAIIVLPSLRDTISFIVSEVFFADDDYRGTNSGLVGRLDTYESAWLAIKQYPIIGSGLDQSIYVDEDDGVHNGFLALAAEYGALSSVIFSVIALAILRAYRRDRFLLLVLLACLFIFFFGARTVNLNVFPFLLWLCLLPWSIGKGPQVISNK